MHNIFFNTSFCECHAINVTDFITIYNRSATFNSSAYKITAQKSCDPKFCKRIHQANRRNNAAFLTQNIRGRSEERDKFLNQILGNKQLEALFHVFIYFMSLHVSSVTALIIRRMNCINTSSGMISLCKWLLGMPVRRELPFAHHQKNIR